MRSVSAAALVALPLGLGGGCYAPAPTPGLPCSPSGACPAGQTCDLASMICDGTAAPIDAALLGDAVSAPDGAIADAMPEGVAIVYAHDSATLFSLDPDTLAIEVVGPMTGCSGVVDIAVNAAGQIFGSGTTDGGSGIVAIDPVTGACALHAVGGFSNALSFVPAGVLHPAKEMLVSYANVDGEFQYASIDPDTGDVVGLGAPPMGYGSSGDLVSVVGGGTFWSATGPCNDCLVELEPATSALLRDWGAIGASTVWGLAYWGGAVYGFTSTGQILRLTFVADALVSEVVATTAYSFYGAGSTTMAPVGD
jgi:hypothetical protein